MNTENNNEGNIEIKYNEATPLRPEGDRLIDAQMMLMDLGDFRRKITKGKAWKDAHRNAISLFTSGGLRVVLIALHKGSEMKRHTAPGILGVQVLDGTIDLQTDQQSATLTSGRMLPLH